MGETDWERRALEALLELTKTFTEDHPLESALKVVTESALRLLPADHTSIRILDQSGEELLCGARSGRGAGAERRSLGRSASSS